MLLLLFFQNKVDNTKQTGAAGGKNTKYNEIDNLVLDIIGKDSPTITSLNVPETWSQGVNVGLCANVMSEQQDFTPQVDEQCSSGHPIAHPSQVAKKRKVSSVSRYMICVIKINRYNTL